MKIAKDFSTYGLENSENNAYPGCDVRPGMLDRGRDAAATKTVGELISGRYRLSCPWAYRTAMAGPRDGMPTSRELSLEMIGKTRRISKLTPSAAPSVVARGFRDSYRSDGLWLFPETSVPVYDNAFHGPYLTGTRATPVGDAQRATSGLPHRRCGQCCRPGFRRRASGQFVREPAVHFM